MKNKIVIVGATSTIAKHCARIWNQHENTELLLLGRQADNLQQIRQDLHVRNPKNQIEVMVADFKNPHAIEKLVSKICDQGLPRTVLIAQGFLPSQIECQKNLSLVKETVEINAISPVLFAEAFAQNMKEGHIAIIGSVAGDRGRKSNYCYGAAKGLVERYVQGLQHRFYGKPLKISLIKPGPTASKMTVALQQQGAKLASPENVAAVIVQELRKDKLIIYAPRIWALIMMVIRNIPHFIFGRLKL